MSNVPIHWLYETMCDVEAALHDVSHTATVAQLESESFHLTCIAISDTVGELSDTYIILPF